MSRKFISTILAATLAVTTFAAQPARAASEEDIARILAGAATIFIIGKAIQSSRDNDDDGKKKSKSHKDHSDRDRYKPKKHTSRNDDRYHRYGRHETGRSSYGHRSTPLPKSCQVTARTRGGHEALFGARCLDRSYQSARRLPGECLRNVQSFRGERQAYSGSCLRARGYTTASR